MEQSSDPHSAAANLALGQLRGSAAEAWRLMDGAWLVLERFVRLRLINARLPTRLVEDCGQEVFTRVWRFRASYRGSTEAEFWRWLGRICENEVRRISCREARHAGPLAAADASAVPGLLTDPNQTADTAVLGEELTALRECIRTLDDGRRRVIEMAYFEPILPERAIAELLNCSPSNVHKLKTEALRSLRTCLERKGVR